MAYNQETKSSEAWLLLGLTGSKRGTLRLQQGRLSFENDEGQSLFDVPLSEVTNINFPWYSLGAALHFKIAGQQYRISFTRPHDEQLDSGELDTGKAWKKLLT